MKKILKNYRYSVLALLALVTLWGLLSEPGRELSNTDYALTFVATKFIGFAAFFAAVRLIKRWAHRGKIEELVNFVNNGF